MNLFNDKEDYLMYEELLSKYKNQHGFKLFSFVLMPNHIHLLVETKPDTTLSEIMHNITSSYTKYYNKKHNRQGHLFRGRFKAVIIEKEPNLLRLSRYIHLNPKVSGLVSQAEDYTYSSYQAYLGRGPETPLGANSMSEEIGEVSAYLSGSGYQDYMNKECSEENAVLHKGLSRSVFLGSDEFAEAIQKMREGTAFRETEAFVETRANKVRISIISGVVLVAIAGTALFHANRAVKRAAATVSDDTSTVPQPILERAAVLETKAPKKKMELDGMTWQVKFVAGTPFQSIDIIHFSEGRMVSENMDLNGYKSSNYSLTRDGDRIIWETMQTSNTGVALWRGEVEGEQMKGVLSLRPKDGKPQDFSFVSM